MTNVNKQIIGGSKQAHTQFSPFKPFGSTLSIFLCQYMLEYAYVPMVSVRFLQKHSLSKKSIYK